MNKAVVINAGDVLIDFDKPYLQTVPEIFNQIFSPFIGDKIDGVDITAPDENVIREIHCSGKSLKSILESVLFIANKKSETPAVLDAQKILSVALNISEEDVKNFKFDEEDREFILTEIDLWDGNENELFAFHAREELINKALKPLKDSFESFVTQSVEFNGVFIEGVEDVIQSIIDSGSDLKIICIRDQRSGLLFDIRDLIQKTFGIDDNNICSPYIRGLEGKDVKDIFRDLEYLDEGNILVIANHVGLLSRSTGLDFAAVDAVYEEFNDVNRLGGAGFSRLKDKPYHVCTVGYNKSEPMDYRPGNMRQGVALHAQTPNDISNFVDFFISGNLVSSFHEQPKSSMPIQGNAKVLKFPNS